MRIWQKVYFVTLLLFLVMLNMGLFFAAGFVFSYNLKQERTKAETDCYFLCQNLEHDFTILEQNGRYRKNIIEALFEGYKSYYHTQNIELSLEETTKEKPAAVFSDITAFGSKMQISSERNLGAPYQKYRLSYQKRLVDFENIWSSLKRTFAMISLVMSALLCLLLYIFMQRMFKPLNQLNDSVAKIAAGEYRQQISMKHSNLWRKDEISELSGNVNKMSLTIQKQIETLKKESDKKQQLMDNMAHELRTPLTSIYGYAQYLRYAKADADEQYEGLAYIMEESMRLSKMSESMLSMRLYEKEELQILAVDLHALASHLEKLLAQKLNEKELVIKKQFNVKTIYGEEGLFMNLFRNLLENAIRASKTGDEIVWSADNDGEKWIFEIIDYGIGMEQEELFRITEAFYRIDTARSRRDGGVGLGLSIVELIVKKMNGTISFASVPGKGTKVTIILQLSNKDIKSY